MSLRASAVSVGLMLAVSACGGSSPTMKTVEGTLAGGSSLGLSGVLAMAAMSGTASCATVGTACSTYPCTNGAVNVTLGAECPLPLGGDATGSFTVTGNWQSANQATVAVTFGDAKVGGRSATVANATTMSLVRSGNEVQVTFTGQNVSVNDGTSLAAQSTWTVEVDTKGTLGNPADDSYTVTGFQQLVTGATTSQVSIAGAEIVPTCRLNPVDGTATMQEVNGASVKQELLTFHSACDGKADMTSVVSGNALGGSSSTVTLDFMK